MIKVTLIFLTTLISVFGEPLRFSDTQTLDERLKTMSDTPSLLNIDWVKVSELPVPPDDQQECDFLIKLQDEKLNKAVIERIKEQENVDFYYFGEELLEGKPNTERLLKVVDFESRIAILNQKLKFDRVRPKYVNNTVEQVIKTPEHPSYPSGYATQGSLFAMLYSSLDPQNKDEYKALADEVALNRELAGISYRSDTYIGKLYAKFLLSKITESESFQGLYLAAVEEWGKADDFPIKFTILKALTMLK